MIPNTTENLETAKGITRIENAKGVKTAVSRENVTGNLSENAAGEVSEVQTLTQEAVNEQIKDLLLPNASTRGIDSDGTGNCNNTASGPLPQGSVWYHFWYSHSSVRQSAYEFHVFKKITNYFQF